MAFLHTPKQRAALLVIALGLAIFLALTPFATGLLGIPVLYVIFAPVHRLLSRVLPRSVAAILAVLLAFALVLLPFAIVLDTAVREAPGTVRGLQEADLPGRLSRLRVGGMDVGEQAASAAGTVFGWGSQQAFSFFGSAARGSLSLLLALFGMYYMLMSAPAVWAALRPFLPFSDRAAGELGRRFFLVTKATLLGTLFTALLQGSLVGIGFALVGLPNAVFWATMTAVVSVLPIMGSAIVWLPGVVVLAVNGRWGAAALLTAIGMVAAGADNVVRMIVYKQVSDIHPLATLVGAFAGLEVFGLLGVLLGPLAIAWFFELLRMYREEYGEGAALQPAAASAAEPGPGIATGPPAVQPQATAVDA